MKLVTFLFFLFIIFSLSNKFDFVKDEEPQGDTGLTPEIIEKMFAKEKRSPINSVNTVFRSVTNQIKDILKKHYESKGIATEPPKEEVKKIEVEKEIENSKERVRNF